MMEHLDFAVSPAIYNTEEVADQLLNGTINPDEKIGEAVLEDDELIVDILYDEPMDVRVHGCKKREEVFSLRRIRDVFVNAEYIVWAKDVDGNDVLVCFEI